MGEAFIGTSGGSIRIGGGVFTPRTRHRKIGYDIIRDILILLKKYAET